MKKFTKINESYDLKSFVMSNNDFHTYKNFINSLLWKMHENNLVKVNDLILIKALPAELRYVREYSVLNKVNTNILLLRKLTSLFDANNTQDLMQKISYNKDNLFYENGKYFYIVFQTIRSTEKKGEENEEIVSDYIKNLVQNKFNKNIKPTIEPTASYKDMILGIDITFNIDGKDYTCQVKPIKSFKMDNESIIIESPGLLKQYNTDYIAFSNKDKNILLLFRNKNRMQINDSTVRMDKKNLVE